jgi:hypothetical protein
MLYYPVPNIGDIVFCSSCDNYRTVTGGNAHNIPAHRVICSNCNYRRNYYGDSETVNVKGETHAIAYKHLVTVFDEDNGITGEFDHRENVIWDKSTPQ